MTAAAPIDQTVVPAATLVVFRHGAAAAPEILFVERSRELSFAGSATVFPGGKVHDSDIRLVQEHGGLDEVDGAARVAAIRETLEETGLVLGIREKPSMEEAAEARRMAHEVEDLGAILDRFGWTLALDSLVPFARWLPTHKPGRIFDTRFYLADIGTGNVELSPDSGENTHLFWATASSAGEMVKRGEIKMIFPTRCNLQRLMQFASFDDAAAHARSTPMVTVSPWREIRDGVEFLQIPEDAGYPVTSARLDEVRG